MAEIKNEIVLNVLMRCENADEATGAIGALVTTGVVSMNDVIKTMYNQYAEEVSSRNDEYEELVGENIELALKIAELENLSATPEELEEKYKSFAEQYKVDVK